MFALKVGDLLPELEATLVNKATGKPVGDLTLATVDFRYKLPTDTVWETISATIVDGPRAMVSVPWASGDTDVAGDYTAEFVITFPGPLQMSVPNEGCFLFRISEC